MPLEENLKVTSPINAEPLGYMKKMDGEKDHAGGIKYHLEEIT